MFIDSHAHVDSSEFEPDRAAVLERARVGQVERILVVGSGTGWQAMEAALRLVEKYPFLDLAVGVHPHEAGSATASSLDEVKQIARHPKVVAWGEIGLDFHYDHSPRGVQKNIFSRQLVLAGEHDLPVIIHSREAESETLEILQKHGRSGRGGVLHCFTGSLALAEECIEMGFMVSFSGMLTFPKAGNIREVAQKLPLERLLIETDSPYLAPVRHRGKRNEPAYVVETARTLADLRSVNLSEIARITTENYRRFFRIERN